ncbi:MAG: diguanylate cyclase, partial [Alphaproteobacteria bacterium]
MTQPVALTPDLDLPQLRLNGGLAARFGTIAKRALRRSPEDAHLLSELLEYAAAAEERLAEQRARIAYLESLATTDELTGLANRRGFERILKTAIAAARRHEEQGVLGFFD